MLLLAFFFLCGVIFGQVLAKSLPASTGAELKHYLNDYIQLNSDNGLAPYVVISTFIVYFRYPLLALLLGFASIGVVLLPGISFLFGFFLSFAVCCFIATFGDGGVLLALAVFGLRCVVTLPCYFLLSVPSMQTAALLVSLSFGRGRSSVIYGSDWWKRAGLCAAILTAGMCVDLFLSPWFLRLALEGLLA